MNEIHDHKEEVSSSNELLTAERDPTAARNLVLSVAWRTLARAFPAILLVILSSREPSFLEVNEN